MDADLVLIFAFVVVLTVIIGITINGVFKKLFDYKRSKNAALPGANSPELANVLERTAHIEDRLKVLERIATDPEARRGAELAQEIEQLRLDQGREQSLEKGLEQEKENG
ncbi:MAG: hypothetical protein AAF291_17180 [Pseudomonadota bacterium]